MLDRDVESPFSYVIVFALAGLPDGFHGLFSTLELQLGLFVLKIMKEPESISSIIEGLIECFYLDELEKEADAWDALTHEQKYGTLEGAK